MEKDARGIRVSRARGRRRERRRKKGGWKDEGKREGKSRERDLGFFLPRDFRASTRQLSGTGISRILVIQLRSNSSVLLLNAEEGRRSSRGYFHGYDIRKTGVLRGEKRQERLTLVR